MLLLNTGTAYKYPEALRLRVISLDRIDVLPLFVDAGKPPADAATRPNRGTEGFEEIEAVAIVDLLRRADIEVRTAALGGREVTGSHGITVVADASLDEVDAGDYDMIVLPGGMPGTAHLKSDSRVTQLLRQFAESGRYTAAICAAPSVLAHAGLLEGRRRPASRAS